MEDPFSSYDTDAPSGNNIPTWVWVVGGLVLGGGCCLMLIIGGLMLAGPRVEAMFEDISSVLDADLATIEPTAASSNETTQENGRLFGTAEAVLQRENDPEPSLDPYRTNFDEPLGWATGTINSNVDSSVVNAEVNIEEGVLRFEVYDENGLYWATADELFANGTYEIEATAVEGTLDNGFGLLFMVDNTADDFYMFEISSDGYVWIGYYINAGEIIEPLVEDGWFASEAINQGLEATNKLRIAVDNGDLTFYINDTEVAQIRDFKLLQGDVGVFVETLGEGSVTINFDNFTYEPLP